MAAFWYVGRDGTGKGPVDANEIGWRVKGGEVTPETLVWLEGMPEWRPAGEVEALRELFAAPSPPGAPPSAGGPRGIGFPAPSAAPHAGNPLPGAAPAAADARIPATIGPLHADFEVWGLFWRAIVAFLGQATIVFAPWAAAIYWKYVGERTRLPDGTPFSFGGQPGDIWWVFVLQGVLLWSNQVHYVGSLAFFANLALSWLVIRWFCDRLRLGEGGPSLSFEGGFLPFVGYMLLFVVSLITIVGWAWVARAFMVWACGKVGGPLRFDFRGSAVELLWRGFALVAASVFVLPIPWAAAWYARWLVSKIEVVGARAA